MLVERLASLAREKRREGSGFVLGLTGPTASGKTSLAISLAQELDGEIVSCDSMQVYRSMNLGTAKPDQRERGGIAHHMLDVVDPWEAYNVVRYQQQAQQCISSILGRGRLPIVAGGTGLYLSALTENVCYPETQADPDLRQRLQAIAAEEGPAALHRMLQEADPQAALQIHPNNIKRVVRALEAYQQTGLSLHERNEQSRGGKPAYAYSVFVLNRDREALYRRIDRRVEEMIQAGLPDEAKQVYEACNKAYREGRTDLPPLRQTALQAIGYKEWFSVWNGSRSREEAAAEIKQHSRNYAKRQLTWFRKQTDWQWINLSVQTEEEHV